MDTRYSLAVRSCVVALSVFAGFLAASARPSAQAVSPSAASMAECTTQAREIVQAMREWSADGRSAVYDTKAFWSALGPEANFQALARYLTIEDGVHKPIRTGREVVLYEGLKKVIRSTPPGTPVNLSFARVMQLALDASADGTGRANISTALLTAHNVVRVLARPLQWTGPGNQGDYGHPPSDPMTPIFDDLRRVASGTLPQIMISRGMNIRSLPGGTTSGDWSMQLFNQDKGVFSTANGASNAEWNGGSHYYFWIGALARTHLGGGAILWGIAKELDAKRAGGIEEQGIVEISHFVCGSLLSNRVFAERAGFVADGPLALLNLEYPGALAMGRSDDLRVHWQGSATFPVTLELQPAPGCLTDCRTLSTSASGREVPLVGSGFVACGPGVLQTTHQYQAVLSDAGGQRTEASPVIYTCLPTTREGVVNVSGGLDQASVDYQIKKWNDRGWTFEFPPSFASFQLLEDGTARISETIVFREDDFLRSDPTHNYGHITRTYWTLPGRGTVESASGKLWQCEDHVWFWGKQHHVYCDDTWTEQGWSVRRQPDGSYLLTILNGMAAVYAEIPYRLK
jgi:hypothetical protein